MWNSALKGLAMSDERKNRFYDRAYAKEDCLLPAFEPANAP